MITAALHHTFPAATLDIAFSAPLPSTTVLLGPSGSGKSIMLLAIAGLFRPNRLHVSLGGEVLSDTGHEVFVPPERRRVGMVVQGGQLFPHMDVEANLRFGLRRIAASVTPQIGFNDVARLLGLERVLARRPQMLSAGERVRVALGRALLSQPSLLLMDQPLAGLDDAAQAATLSYLLAVKRAYALPMVYVTHSMFEMTALADHVVLLEKGRVQASGALSDVSSNPALPTALRDDAGAVLRMRIIEHDHYARLTRLQAGPLSIDVPLQEGRSGMVRIRVPAREIFLARSQPSAISINNVISGRVRLVRVDNERNIAMVQVAVGDNILLARVTRNAIVRLGLEQGAAVIALVKSSSIEVMPGEA